MCTLALQNWLLLESDGDHHSDGVSYDYKGNAKHKNNYNNDHNINKTMITKCQQPNLIINIF